MRVGHVSGQRQQPIDRLMYAIGTFWSGDGVAPHAATDRFTFYVPTDCIAIITQSEAIVQRATAATTVGRVKAYVACSWGFLTCAYLLRNNVGDAVHSIVPFTQPLLPNDYVIGYTEDASTGGTVDYYLNYIGYLIYT